MSTPTCQELLDLLKHDPATEVDIEWHLAARAQRVLALHKPVQWHAWTVKVCEVCRCWYPCPTVKLLDGEEGYE